MNHEQWNKFDAELTIEQLKAKLVEAKASAKRQYDYSQTHIERLESEHAREVKRLATQLATCEADMAKYGQRCSDTLDRMVAEHAHEVDRLTAELERAADVAVYFSNRLRESESENANLRTTIGELLRRLNFSVSLSDIGPEWIE
jgi:DNA-binding transcriptional MerR regulator